MKARNLIITAGAIIALAASPALAAIPSDGGPQIGLGGQTLHVVKATQSLKKQVKASATTIKASAYDAHGYVNREGSDKVGNAITKVGKKKVGTTKVVTPASTAPHIIWVRSVGTPTPAPDLDPEQECLINGNCTIEQNCAIWGLYCNQVQNQQSTTVAPAAAASVAEASLVSAVVSVADALGEGPASSSAGSTDASDEEC